METIVYAEVEAIKETDKAILVRQNDLEVWIPKSKIIDTDSEVMEEGDEGNLAIPEWLADDKELDYFTP